MALPKSNHDWVVAPYRRDREAAVAPVEGICYAIDAHRNHRGPYTAAGTLVRRIVRRGSASASDLSPGQQLTLLSVAPELRDEIDVSEGVADTFSFSVEGRVPNWTRRLAHGLTEFLLDHFARASSARCCVVFDNVEYADPVDWEFIAVLLRRADPRRLLVTVCTSSDVLDGSLLAALHAHATTIRPKAPGAGAAGPEIPSAWRAWLLRHAAGWRGEWNALTDLANYLDLAAAPQASSLSQFLDEAVARLPSAAKLALADDYVASNCTSDRLLARHAYAGLAADQRRDLHRARAKALEALQEKSLSLGAIPFHHEQAGDAVEPLLAASKDCIHMDYYAAALDWALRGRRLLDRSERGTTYVQFIRSILFSLLLLGRFEEVETLCAECRSETDPSLVAYVSYAMAVLNARFFARDRRNYDLAKTWVEKALASTEQLAESPRRTLNLAFLRNTMALVEMRKGHAAAAEQLLSEAIEYLARQAPDLYETDCAIFLHNRARLYIANGQLQRAIDELTDLLRNEPSNSEAYCDRGLLYHRMGRDEDALRDYDLAIKWSPPYADPHLNRASSLVALGRTEEAFAEYDYVLALDPEHIEALINRARLYYEQKRFGAAQDDIERGLRVSPANARMLCVRGLLEQKRGDPDAAYRSFSAAIEADHSLADAWANRATILYRRNDFEAALADLTRASTLRGDAAILYNRGRVLEALSRWQEAVDDYTRALAFANGDASHILHHRDICLRAMRTMAPPDDSHHSNSGFTGY